MYTHTQILFKCSNLLHISDVNLTWCFKNCKSINKENHFKKKMMKKKNSQKSLPDLLPSQQSG